MLAWKTSPNADELGLVLRQVRAQAECTCSGRHKEATHKISQDLTSLPDVELAGSRVRRSRPMGLPSSFGLTVPPHLHIPASLSDGQGSEVNSYIKTNGVNEVAAGHLLQTHRPMLHE